MAPQPKQVTVRTVSTLDRLVILESIIERPRYGHESSCIRNENDVRTIQIAISFLTGQETEEVQLLSECLERKKVDKVDSYKLTSILAAQLEEAVLAMEVHFPGVILPEKKKVIQRAISAYENRLFS